MKNSFWRAILGLGLIFVGLISILQILNIIQFEGQLWGFIFAAFFILAGLIFISVLFSDRSKWWAAIPGFSLLGLGALMGVSLLNDAWAEVAAIFLFLSVSLGFWVVFFLDRKQWWAIIPAGSLIALTLTIFNETVLIPSFNLQIESGAIMLLGLALTFALTAILPAREHKTQWAWFPAIILLVIGLLAGLAATPYLNFLWPLLLIAGGGYLVVKALAKNS